MTLDAASRIIGEAQDATNVAALLTKPTRVEVNMAHPIEDLPGEIWKPVVGLDGFYSVSDRGRVRSEPRIGVTRDGHRYPVPGCVLRPCRTSKGYLMVHMKVGGRRTAAYVHHLVIESFIGPRPSGMVACHGDGSKENNTLANLRWDTPSGNEQDKVRHGTRLRGESSPTARLTRRAVLEIRQLADNGTTQDAIAEMFKISQSNVSLIVRRERWAHVGVPQEPG